MLAIDLSNLVSKFNTLLLLFFYSAVLQVKNTEMFFLKFILTFRLAIDDKLHQKNRLWQEKQHQVRAVKITVNTSDF